MRNESETCERGDVQALDAQQGPAGGHHQPDRVRAPLLGPERR